MMLIVCLSVGNVHRGHNRIIRSFNVTSDRLAPAYYALKADVLAL